VKSHLTVLLPVHNQEQSLLADVERLIAQLDALEVRFDLFIVDDGSDDATPQLAGQLADRDARVQVIRHPERYGPGQALHAGFACARGEFTLALPAGSLDRENLSAVLGAAQEVDVVIGGRSGRRPTSFSHCALWWVHRLLLRVLFGLAVRDMPFTCLFRTTVLQEIWIAYPDSAFLLFEVLIKARDMGYALSQIAVDRGKTPLHLDSKSLYDLLHFWAHWVLEKRSEDGSKDWRVGVP
jgi:glycosyltransferase involved in cell wall biosynthesis